MTYYKKLEAWKKSMELVQAVYLLVKSYPKEEMYGLSSQTKRAAVSIPSNIAEGAGRNHKKDKVQFFYIARGSLYELETLLNIAFSIGIVTEKQLAEISAISDECLKILNGLINFFDKETVVP